MSFLDELTWRGLLADSSDRQFIDKLGPGDAVYVGFDPTAPSLQVGNLVPLLASVHIAKAGLQPIFLFGGATGSIGDPSGKNSERNLLEIATVEANLSKQKAQFEELCERASLKVKPIFENNITWTKDVTFLDFLRDVGKHFTVNYMTAKEVVKTRLAGEGISFAEFSYMLLQANDFAHLFQTKSCKLQIGGSDQWGNITAGLELIRKKLGKEATAVSFPLVTDSQGKKFGKSEGNAIWLDPKMTSPYRFHQFWLNVPDADAGKLLRIFTLLPKEQIEALEQQTKSAPEKREAQKALADAVCSFVHGESATQDAKRSAEVLFGGSLDGFSPEQLLDIFGEAPSTVLKNEELGSMDLLTLLSKTVVKSKGEARRLIQSGGIYLNNERVNDEALMLKGTTLSSQGLIVLRSGKKNYHLVRMEIE